MNTRFKRIIFANQVVLSENLNVSLLIFQELIHQHTLSMAQLDPDDNSKKQPCNVMLVVEIYKKRAGLEGLACKNDIINFNMDVWIWYNSRF